ncbi:MAG: hypothetical protein ACRDG5_01185, partial [Anaerolineales bacterium]
MTQFREAAPAETAPAQPPSDEPEPKEGGDWLAQFREAAPTETAPEESAPEEAPSSEEGEAWLRRTLRDAQGAPPAK